MAQEIKHAMTLKGQTGAAGFRLIAGVIEGAINEVPSALMEFTARNKALDLAEYVGTEMGFWAEDENGKKQSFWGTCISAEAVGAADGHGQYIAEIRPWLWFLSRSRNNRIYQNKTTEEIVRDVLGDYGFAGDLRIDYSGKQQKREYCVQYGETDLTFIRRLLDDEGIYFYFLHDDNAVKMVLADGPGTHAAASEDDKYKYVDERADGARERIVKWQSKEKVVPGKVTLRDYDFTKPGSDLTAQATRPSGKHDHKDYEDYRYPGRYDSVSVGTTKAEALIENDAAAHEIWSAAGSIANLHVGKLFEIADHPRHEKSADNGFMVTRIKQFFRVRSESTQMVASVLGGVHAMGIRADQFFFATFEAVLKSKPYRIPAPVARPVMSGVQTAVVTGASGDEVAVDEYGRIKVQFHWDRQGKKDDKSSCWVRTMMPWTGKNWGMMALPRVGQEVVIQFIDGDPDRPICVGMLYNAATMPPYELPANATRTGIKTNSSKGGGGYNELMFEDKKGDELVRFEAEKDYTQLVQNSAHIKVGYKHEKDIKKANARGTKSMKLEVENHLDEIVEKGDHSFEVKSGKQTLKIAKSKTEKIGNDSILTVENNKKTTVKKGDVSLDVEMGNQSTNVAMGNYTLDASLGKIDLTAMQSITLKVGPSQIKLTPDGITISGLTVKINADVMLEAKSTVTQVKGTAMVMINGGLTKIN